MFAQQLDPSFEGKVDRLAPIAMAVALVVAFVLSLAVTVSAVNTAEVLMAHAPVKTKPGRTHAPTVLVKCGAPNTARCG